MRTVWILLLPLLIVMEISIANAEEKTPCEKISDNIAGQCFKVHGRLSFYNGTPSFRIWVAGTHHLLNVTDWWAKSSYDELPDNVRKLLPPDNFISETAIFGDYEVCPLEKEHSGSAQSVCIAHAAHLTPHSLLLEKITVPGANGEHVDKANIFIGDQDENVTHAVRNSNSFTKDTYGDNYYADYNQQKKIEAQIAQLPKNIPVNLIGHGLGGATAAKVAVDLVHTRRINILMTIDPSGDHPDDAIVKSSVNQWVNVNAEGH